MPHTQLYHNPDYHTDAMVSCYSTIKLVLWYVSPHCTARCVAQRRRLSCFTACNQLHAPSLCLSSPLTEITRLSVSSSIRYHLIHPVMASMGCVAAKILFPVLTIRKPEEDMHNIMSWISSVLTCLRLSETSGHRESLPARCSSFESHTTE